MEKIPNKFFSKKKLDRARVFVGLSGGVDSSVSIALLKSQGFDVRGVFIKVWSFSWAADSELSHCSGREDRLDAMRVCAKLGVPFYTLDLEKEYKKQVVDYMITEYKAGRTPNPDVMCNKYIKFGKFFAWAMKQGADYVATGHYAQINQLPEGKAKLSGSTDIFLLKNSSCSRQPRSQASLKASPYLLVAGRDKNKDQSYFLWTLTQKQLSKTIFPVGDLEKPAVRKLAKKFGLPTASKKDSQGLCFIGKVDMVDFLKKYIKTKPGNVLNEKEEIIGTHEGAELYTIGQRHGFVIQKGSPNDNRSFIVAKDVKANTITVSNKIISRSGVTEKEFILTNVNWTLGQVPDLTKTYQARIRYRGRLDKCKLQILGEDKCKIIFTMAQTAPASGQSVVIYDACPTNRREEVCLGGGIIE